MLTDTRQKVILEIERDTRTSLYFMDLVQLQRTKNPFISQQTPNDSYLIATAARIRKLPATQAVSMPQRLTRKQLATFIEKVLHLQKCLGHNNFRVLATRIRWGYFELRSRLQHDHAGVAIRRLCSMRLR